MLSFLLIALIADTTPIHTTVADSSRVAFIAQTPVSWEDVEYDNQDYIIFTDSPLTDSIGYPELPVITCLVAFPDSVTPNLEFAVSAEREQSVDPVYPAPAQVMSYEYTPAVVDSFVQDSTAYASDEFWPSQRVRIIGETRICDQRLLQVQMFPAQYRASDSTLSTVMSFSVSVSFDSASAVWSSTGLGPFQRMVDGSSIVGYHPVLQTRTPDPEYFLEINGSYPREMGQFNLLGDPALDISDRIKYPSDCDLVIHEWDITVLEYPLETSTGTELAMTFTVRNNGALESDAFDARITFSYDEYSSIDYVSCDELSAGEEAEYQYTWDCARWFTTPIELTVKVEVDYLEECDDSWWGNNTASRNVQFNDTYPIESGWPISVEGVVNTTPLLVNLDEDTDLEIVVLTGTSFTAFESDGSAIWEIAGEGFFSGQHPLAADLDQDGEIELLVASSDGIKVISPDGSVLYTLSGSGNLFTVGNMDDEESGLELCVADGIILHLYYWNNSLGRFFHIADKDFEYPGWRFGISLVCSDLTGDSCEDVAYCIGSFALGSMPVPRTLVVYDWESDEIPYSETWDVLPYTSYLAAGELSGTKMVGYSFGSYEYLSDNPSMLVEPDGSTQEVLCDSGSVDAGNLRCAVFADWYPLVTGADAFVLPSEVECLAWNYEGAALLGWPTGEYLDSELNSSISPTALGNLDGLDYSDVLFSTILSGVHSLLAYGSDGDPLDNLDFPIALPDGVAAPGGFSIADIDRDGYVEIVFGTTDGLLHCWEFGTCSTGYAPWIQFQHDHSRTGVLE